MKMNNNTVNQNKDIYWINALKAICMIFVYFGHSELFYGEYIEPVDWFRLTFNTNAFFFISGYLLFWKQLSPPRIEADFHHFVCGGMMKTLGNLLYRIIIPSILFSVIVFYPKILLRGGAFSAREFVFDTIGGTTCWFTSALVVAEIIILLLLTTRIRNIWFYVPICFALSFFGWWIADSGINIVKGTSSFPWQYKQALISLSYIMAGGLYWHYEKQIRGILNKWVLILFLLAYVFVVVFFHSKMELITSLNKINMLGFFVTILATILLIEFCRIIPYLKALTYIGQNTMGYYFLSGGIPNVIAVIIIRIIPISNWLLLLLIWVVSFLISSFIIAIMNRFTPWFFDLRLLKTNKVS